MKLSIIIPVYQAKHTLRRCVASVLGQSFRDWQMVLVDDASTDGSGGMCDELARDNPHVQTIHLKKNSGLSAARNAGLRKAKGEYVTFIDSDDFIAKDSLKMLMEEIAVHPDYDMLEYPIYEHFGSKRQRLLQFSKQEYANMKEYWLAGQAYRHTYACNKIYRRSLWSSVRFPEGKTFEDVFVLPKLLEQCSLVATTDIGLYYYCANAKGITQTATADDLRCLLEANLEAINGLYPTATRRNFSKRLEPAFADYYASVLNIALDVSDRSKASDATPGGFPILPYRHTFKLRLLHLLGLKRLCQLHRIFRKLHSPRQ